MAGKAQSRKLTGRIFIVTQGAGKGRKGKGGKAINPEGPPGDVLPAAGLHPQTTPLTGDQMFKCIS